MDDLGPNKEHLARVASQAKPGETLVDLGVRGGVSSRVMIDAAKECRVIGVDPCERHATVPVDARYTYLQTDSLNAAVFIHAPLYLVFFDTLHIREQVMAELYLYWPKIRVGGWAVFHDTEWPAGKKDFYLGKEWDQAVVGVRDFFRDKPTPVTVTHHSESWGMTFIQKTDDESWRVDGIQEAMMAAEMLCTARCGV